MKVLRVLCVLVALGVSVSGAQAKPPTPLTDVQRLTIRNAALTVELWQTRLQQAAAEYQRAQEAMAKIVQPLQVEGWTLNERLEYVAAPKAAPMP